MFKKEILLDSDHLCARLLSDAVSRIYHEDTHYRKVLFGFTQWNEEIAYVDSYFEDKYQNLFLANGDVEYWATFLNYLYGLQLYTSGSHFHETSEISCLMMEDLMLDNTFQQLVVEQQRIVTTLRNDVAISVKHTQEFLSYQRQFQDATCHGAAVLGYQDGKELWQYIGQFQGFLEQVAEEKMKNMQ